MEHDGKSTEGKGVQSYAFTVCAKCDSKGEGQADY